MVGIAGAAPAGCSLASPNGGPLGDFEAHADVGSPKIAGYATWNAASQVYTLSAGGVNIWAKRDEFQFAYRQHEGRLHRAGAGGVPGQGVDPHRKAGIMARASIADFDSAYVDGALHGDGLTSLQFRKAKGEDTAQTEMPAAKGANVIQLERRGNAVHLVGRALRRAVRGRRDQGRADRARRSLRRPVPLLAQSGRERDRGLPPRARDQAGEGRLPALPRLHRQRGSR